MEEANAVTTSAEPHHQMRADLEDNGEKDSLNVPYRQFFGSLMYLSIATVPEITFSINSASQHFFSIELLTGYSYVKRIIPLCLRNVTKLLGHESEHGTENSHVSFDCDSRNPKFL